MLNNGEGEGVIEIAIRAWKRPKMCDEMCVCMSESRVTASEAIDDYFLFADLI